MLDGRQARRGDVVQPDGQREVAHREATAVAQRGAVGQRPAEQQRGLLAEHHLPAVGDGADARRLVHGQGDVAAVTGSAWPACTPARTRTSAPAGQACASSSTCAATRPRPRPDVGEGEERAVTLGVDDDPAGGLTCSRSSARIVRAPAPTVPSSRRSAVLPSTSVKAKATVPLGRDGLSRRSLAVPSRHEPRVRFAAAELADLLALMRDMPDEEWDRPAPARVSGARRRHAPRLRRERRARAAGPLLRNGKGFAEFGGRSRAEAADQRTPDELRAGLGR